MLWTDAIAALPAGASAVFALISIGAFLGIAFLTKITNRRFREIDERCARRIERCDVDFQDAGEQGIENKNIERRLTDIEGKLDNLHQPIEYVAIMNGWKKPPK